MNHNFEQHSSHYIQEHDCLDDHLHYSSVDEPSRTINIRDIFGNIQYTISLFQYFDHPLNKNLYSVEATCLHKTVNPIVVFSRNRIPTYDDALVLFKNTIENYQHLIECEHKKHYNDINQYCLAIDYQPAKCCKNCKFSKMFEVATSGHDTCYILECHNPELFKHACNKAEHESVHLNLHPEVNAEMLCKYFQDKCGYEHKHEHNSYCKDINQHKCCEPIEHHRHHE